MQVQINTTWPSNTDKLFINHFIKTPNMFNRLCSQNLTATRPARSIHKHEWKPASYRTRTILNTGAAKNTKGPL